jgi:hypothetical protein
MDEMSDISKSSTGSSFWRSNPISNYRRHLEEKTQLRKDREIQESRQRAAARLKPKDLDEGAKLRLKELQEARNRRKARKVMESVNEKALVYPSDVEKSLRRWNVSLSSHGFFTKIFVMQFLMVFLFCLLYLDTAFSKLVAARGGTFGMERGRDLATLTYIGVAGVVHSVFCYIALIYSFASLQLGSIAGRRTRRFYSEYVHFGVAMASASMVGLGVIKPGIDRVLRWFIWNTHSILKVAKVSLLAKIPDKFATVLYVVINAMITVFSTTWKLFLKIFVESNVLGSSISSTTRTFSVAICNPFTKYAETAIKQYEGDLDAISWREDTFFMTRALLSHSAFFLLVLLLLFNFSAKQARTAIYVDDDTETSSLSQTESNSLIEMRSSDSIDSSTDRYHVNEKVVTR